MTKVKVVRFGEISERFIPDLRLSAEEQDSLWFTRKQMRRFRRQAESDEKEPARISPARFNQRQNYIQNVLKVQSHNKTVGLNDPVGLGAVAVALSKGAMEQAHFRAVKDASVAAREVAASRPQGLFTTETGTDAKHPGVETRKTKVAINAPTRNRTAANMA